MSKANFNPLSPCGERRQQGVEFDYINEFQSTLPVRGETSNYTMAIFSDLISIHSPRAGRDDVREGFVFDENDFNPLSPCGERHI